MLSIPVRPRVLADAIPGAWVRDVVLVVAFAALTGLAAQVVLPLPFTPVPITGQTFAVLLGGAALGWRRGALGMALYLVAGLLGVHWFAGGTGGFSSADLAPLGYAVGFVPAAALVGWLAARRFDRHPLRTLLMLALGNLAIYAVGVPWLMVTAHLDLVHGLLLGVVPFLIGDALKAVIASALLPGAWRLLHRSRLSG